ncbi:MAG: hypothetical protein GEV07_23870 [Streptosporangiales bacterium]|nr:hypothetical protein [Streptosporangiales bacterium]
MGGAIIYLVIVAVWAVVLVPRWLRAHDRVAETSTPSAADEPHGRVLARRFAADTAPAAEAPVAEAEPADQASPTTVPSRSYEPRARAHRAAVRRRAVFGLLLLAIAGTAVAAGFGALPWWSVAGPVLLMPLYVVHVRRLIVAEHARRRRAERARRLSYATAVEYDTTDEDLPAPASMQAYRSRRAAPEAAPYRYGHESEAGDYDVRRAAGG